MIRIVLVDDEEIGNAMFNKLRRFLRGIIAYKGNIKLDIKSGRLLWFFYFYARSFYLHCDGRALLPSSQQRIRRMEDPLAEFSILNEPSSVIEPMGTVNLVMRGQSAAGLDFGQLKGQVFLVNWEGKTKYSNVYYATADQNHLARFIKSGMFPIFFVVASLGPFMFRDKSSRKIFNDPLNKKVCLVHAAGNLEPMIGSALACSAALGKLAEHVNIYGWDHYLKSSSDQLSDRQVLWNYTSPRESGCPASSIACSIYNFHYSARFAENKKFSVRGYAPSVARKRGLERKMSEIFYGA